MIRLSPSKINLGLRIIKKRDDGYHDLQSIMVPLPFCDILEIHPNAETGKPIVYSQTGINPGVSDDNNLVVKAFRLFCEHVPEVSVRIHLHKKIPAGAGLGGGSSNGATVLRMLNELFGKPLEEYLLLQLASKLGSDCPFFLYRKPMLMEGRGEILSPVPLQFEGIYLVLLNPGIHISTAWAYERIIPSGQTTSLAQLITFPPDTWKGVIFNDFEEVVFEKYGALMALKGKLYETGAFYASLSGSGSSLYALYTEKPTLSRELKEKMIWEGAWQQITQIQ